MQAVFPLATFIILPFIAESPRWLASRGRYDEVYDVVSRLEGRARDLDIDRKANEIIDAAKREAELEVSWLDLFRNGELQNLRRMILGVVPQFIQQFSGINAVVYYGPAIFASLLGLSPRMAAIVGGCGSICFWLGSCTPIFFVEKIGRRKVMLWGLSTTAISMAGLTIATYYAQYESRQVASAYGALVCILLYEFCYGASWAGIPWVYAPEINSLLMRNRASAIASATEWMSAFVVVQITPIGVANIGWKFYLIWLVSCAVALPYIYLFYPETSGATLEEMDDYFINQRNWIVVNSKNIRKFNEGLPDNQRLSCEKQGLEATDGAASPPHTESL